MTRNMKLTVGRLSSLVTSGARTRAAGAGCLRTAPSVPYQMIETPCSWSCATPLRRDMRFSTPTGSCQMRRSCTTTALQCQETPLILSTWRVPGSPTSLRPPLGRRPAGSCAPSAGCLSSSRSLQQTARRSPAAHRSPLNCCISSKCATQTTARATVWPAFRGAGAAASSNTSCATACRNMAKALHPLAKKLQGCNVCGALGKALSRRPSLLPYAPPKKRSWSTCSTRSSAALAPPELAAPPLTKHDRRGINSPDARLRSNRFFSLGVETSIFFLSFREWNPSGKRSTLRRPPPKDGEGGVALGAAPGGMGAPGCRRGRAGPGLLRLPLLLAAAAGAGTGPAGAEGSDPPAGLADLCGGWAAVGGRESFSAMTRAELAARCAGNGAEGG